MTGDFCFFRTLSIVFVFYLKVITKEDVRLSRLIKPSPLQKRLGKYFDTENKLKFMCYF